MRLASKLASPMLLGLAGVLVLWAIFFRSDRETVDVAAKVPQAKVVSPSQPSDRTDNGSRPPIVRSAVSTTKSVITASARGPTLPPVNTRLIDVYPRLKQMAEAGNTQAGCRLGYELDRCRQLKHMEAAVKNLSAQLTKVRSEGKTGTSLANRLEQVQRLYADAARACSDFPEEDTYKGWEYILFAAERGHGPSIMNFVVSKMGLDWTSPVNTAQGWVAYKESAPRLLQLAMEMGIPKAYEFAAASHASPDPPHRVLPFDPLRAVTIYKALRMVASDSYKAKLDSDISYFATTANLSGADLAKAEAEAATISARIAQRANGSYDGNEARDFAKYCESE